MMLEEIHQALFRLEENNRLRPINRCARRLARSDLPRLAEDLCQRLRGKRPLRPEPPVAWVLEKNKAYDIHIIQPGSCPILMLFDASSRREMEVQLIQNAKTQALGQLAGGIAHDFNNLLTGILGHCDAAIQSVHNRKQLIEDLRNIRQNSERASKMISQLLAFARKQDLVSEIIDLPEAIDRIWELLTKLVGEMIQIEIQVDKAVSPVRMDRIQLEQIMINLVINARDAMPFGGSIIFRLEEVKYDTASRNRDEIILSGRYTRLCITDSGSGIDEVTMDRIFDPFYTTKQIGQGTGLGLSVIDGIMRQSGGYVTVENSKDSLQGAQFSLLFPATGKARATRKKHKKDQNPAQSESEEKKASEEKANEEKAKEKKGTVLLVEDEDSIRKILGRSLRSKGVTVLEAGDGDEALEVMNEHKINLLITDLIMPGITGDRLIKEIFAQFGPIHVICISGYAEHVLFDALRTMKDVEIIYKPFNIRDLRKQVLSKLPTIDKI